MSARGDGHGDGRVAGPAARREDRARGDGHGDGKTLDLTLRVWRQARSGAPGRLVTYRAEGISPDMSFLEMIDVVNSRLELSGEEPIAFDSDCREGICGSCALMIDGIAHGPDPATAACQLHMRRFKDGDTIVIEPRRSRAFPVLKDLITDRSALDRIIQAGGFISVNTGGAPEANLTPVPKEDAERAMDAAACIACGACVAACPNGSAMLFTSAKVSHLAHLPQGQPERYERVQRMILAMDREGFGNCSNHRECEAVCPKSIRMVNIALMNRDYMRALSRAKAPTPPTPARPPRKAARPSIGEEREVQTTGPTARKTHPEDRSGEPA